MIQHRTMLTVADNSGAKRIQCIRLHGGYQKRYGRIGDVITVAVKEVQPHSAVKKGDVAHAVVVRTRKEFVRANGVAVRFDDNAAVLIDQKTKEPRATRIFGPVPRELRAKGFSKIISLAQEVL